MSTNFIGTGPAVNGQGTNFGIPSPGARPLYQHPNDPNRKDGGVTGITQGFAGMRIGNGTGNGGRRSRHRSSRHRFRRSSRHRSSRKSRRLRRRC